MDGRIARWRPYMDKCKELGVKTNWQAQEILKNIQYLTSHYSEKDENKNKEGEMKDDGEEQQDNEDEYHNRGVTSRDWIYAIF